MDLKKKYFGMTVMQLGILGGLAILVVLMFCIVGFLVLGKARGAALSKIATAAPTIEPAPTLIVTPTISPTPGPTPLPYESLIPAGWAQYRTSLYEIWMMPGYKNAKADALVTGLGGSPITDLSLSGSTSKKAPNKIYLTVSYEPLTTGTFDEFVNQKLTSLGLAPSERSKVTLNGVPALRLVFTGRKANNTDVNELTYVIQDGTTIWYVQYTAELNDFFNMLPNFETSAKTFRVVR
jgi:hypothetical protein